PLATPAAGPAAWDARPTPATQGWGCRGNYTTAGDASLFNPENAQYLNLNSTGSSIWNLLEAPAELEELIFTLQARYAVDPETCRHETEVFVAEALKRGMLAETQPA
ncbi:PqqD family protein, partial [Cyanobium sp. BA20m-p-22]|uniref:PqqD family protein n=1 Tax=Cyanobium sp. BA20m-p-22 TaxID=2823704 RepID=UPI0020CDF883